MQAFGYPALALSAIDDAIAIEPDHSHRQSNDVNLLPASVRSLVFTLRGYAHSHLGEEALAVQAFTTAIKANPVSPAAFACRGMETYPSVNAISDLEQAVASGILWFWPTYLLAHASLTRHQQGADWLTKAIELAPDVMGLRRNLQILKQLEQAQRDSGAFEWVIETQIQPAAADLQRAVA